MSFTLAIDAMGGDLGVSMVIPGTELALTKTQVKGLRFLLYGDAPAIEKALEDAPLLRACSEVIHTDVIVTNYTKPAVAVRSGRKSNLGMAIDAVREGRAHAVVSAGNTGAYMALSKVLLKTLDGINRPAIPAVMPTTNRHGRTIVLDLGANIECSSLNLVQFALMGEAFAAKVFNIDRPTVGLLNVGSEELKGHAGVQEAFQLLRGIPNLNFHGFVEGDDIMAGTTDVVVTDGFSGNIALKAIEGTTRFVRHLLHDCMSSSWRGKLGYLIAKPAFDRVKQVSDARYYNGAVFLGLRHIAVKSHGGTDAIGFANAVGVAINMVKSNFIESVQARLTLLQTQQEQIKREQAEQAESLNNMPSVEQNLDEAKKQEQI
jgi:glycerol-3-phosphate acyltransferase PlsX